MVCRHDEPSVKFISSQPGSGNTMTYVMKLSKDPKKLPTPSGSVTDYGQLSVAPWFGLPMCDPKLLPGEPVHPRQRHNSGSISDPNAAGSRSWSCSSTRRASPVHRQHKLQRDQVVRSAHHRQPRSKFQFRKPQPQLHGAGQLRIPAD